MGIKGKKLLLIGIDQAIPYLIKKFYNEGLIPNIGQLIDNGVMGEAYSCAPCDTPTNWTTIATGATTGNHGVTSFYMHLPGETLNLGMKYRSRTQLYKYCKAEYLWDVADNNGLKPFVLNYPSGWPSKFKNGVMSLFTWHIPDSLPKMLIKSGIYSLALDSNGQSNRINIGKYVLEELERVSQNLDLSIIDNSYNYLKNIKISLNQSRVEGEEYDSLKICIADSENSKIIKVNEWSEWIEIEINSKYGILPSLFRIKPIEIDLKGKSIRLERSGVYNVKGWSYPESFGKKLVKNVFEYDLPKKRDVQFMIYGKMKNYLKFARNESLSLVQAIDFAKRDMNWNFCFFHYHPLDTINHDLLAYLHKNSRVYTEKKAVNALKNVETAYKIVDEMVGELMNKCIDNDTITIFVSDHGAIPIWKVVNITKILTEAGLMSYKFNHTQQKYLIDWKYTKVFPYMEPPFIWVNLKNRDPQGIVEQKDYESIRDEVIDILTNVKDPKNHENIIDLALKKEDAVDFGLKGERVGDIVYFLNPPYGIFDGDVNALDSSNLSSFLYNKPICYNSKRFFGAHAYYTPDTRFGDFSVSVPLIISGKGISKGLTMKKIVNLTDIASTISHLLDIPKPKQCEGDVIYDILE